MTIVLSGRLPAGDHNGLDAIADVLTGYPQQAHLVLAAVTCEKTTTQTKTGKIVATARIVDIEAFAYASEDWTRLRGLLDERRERRTGQVPLPLGDE